jgi:hypothetical protein
MTQLDAAYTKWRKVIAAGNDNFELRHTLITLVYYFRAIDLAVLLVKQWPLSQRAIHALLVSYHNLAELYEREKCMRQAWQVLVTAKQQMMVAFCKQGERAGLNVACQQARKRLSQFENAHGRFAPFSPPQKELNTYTGNGLTALHSQQPVRR